MSTSSRTHRRATAQNDHVGQRHHLAVGLGAVEVLLDFLQGSQRGRQLRGIVHLPILLRRKAQALRHWHHHACRCRGRSPQTPRRWRRVGQRRVRRRGFCPLGRRCPRRRSGYVIDIRHRVLPDQFAALGNQLARGSALRGPMSRWMSLNHALAKASANSLGFS